MRPARIPAVPACTRRLPMRYRASSTVATGNARRLRRGMRAVFHDLALFSPMKGTTFWFALLAAGLVQGAEPVKLTPIEPPEWLFPVDPNSLVKNPAPAKPDD